MAGIERIGLWVVVVALALALGWFAITDGCSETKLSCEPSGEPSAALDKKLESILNLLGEMAERSEADANAIRAELNGLPTRVAEAVYDRLQQEDFCRSPAEPCRTIQPLSIAGKYTLLYDNARLIDDKITTNSSGVKLAPRHERRLDRLVHAFRACQRDDARKVKFSVTGFSSTAEFLVEEPAGPTVHPKSNKLNVDTANLRGQVVAQRLQNAGFEVELGKKWKSFQELERPYLDDSGPGDQQALNRSVYIEVIHAGACNLAKLRLPEGR